MLRPTTKAKLLLEELNVHAEDVASDDVGPLLATLFELGVVFVVLFVEERGF